MYPVSRAYRASASLRFPTSSRANSTSRDWLWQFIGRHSIRQTCRFGMSRISSGKARRALSSGVRAYNFQPFFFDLALPVHGWSRRNEITRFFVLGPMKRVRISHRHQYRESRVKTLGVYPLLLLLPRARYSIDRFLARHIFSSERDFSFSPRWKFGSNERTVGCCKTANETLQGLDALNSKRAPFRTPFLRHLPAGTSVLVPSQPEMQYGRRGENNAQLAALYSFSQKSLCVCASRYTNVFPRTYTRSVRTIDRQKF